MKLAFISIVLLIPAVSATAAAPEKITLQTGPDLSRADIYIVPAVKEAAGTLILCPGFNGNGEELVEDREWNEYAKSHNLNLVGLSFASDSDSPDHGYFNARSGSGQILLAGLRQGLGLRLGPLFLYGFSRGAQFTYSFTRANPGLVLAWCAYSATQWEAPEKQTSEPCGIIACGDEDEPNYSAAMFQFLEGRSLARSWTWISLAHTGHWRSRPLESFARAYFAEVLLNPGERGVWQDVDTKTTLAAAGVQTHPTLAAWLPDEKVAGLWRNLHQP
jgi:predicted esterase